MIVEEENEGKAATGYHLVPHGVGICEGRGGSWDEGHQYPCQEGNNGDSGKEGGMEAPKTQKTRKASFKGLRKRLESF